MAGRRRADPRKAAKRAFAVGGAAAPDFPGMRRGRLADHAPAEIGGQGPILCRAARRCPAGSRLTNPASRAVAAALPSRLPFWPGARRDLNRRAIFAAKARRGRVVAPRACGGRRPRPARFARMSRCGGTPAALLTRAQSARMRREYPQHPPNRGFKRGFAAELGI